jgi:hypothetical protein
MTLDDKSLIKIQAVSGIITLLSVLSIGCNIFDLDTSRFGEWKMFASRYVPESLLE